MLKSLADPKRPEPEEVKEFFAARAGPPAGRTNLYKRFPPWPDNMKSSKQKNAPQKNPHVGSDFDDFLREEGLYEEVTAEAIKRAFAARLNRLLMKRRLTKTALAGRLETSRAAIARLLDQTNTSVTLTTLAKSAHAVGCRLKIELVEVKPHRAREQELVEI